MEEELKTLINTNNNLQLISKYSKEELEIIRILINLNLIQMYKNNNTNEVMVKSIKTCINENYNLLDYMLRFRYRVASYTVTSEDSLEKIKQYPVCNYCKCKNCIKKSVSLILEAVDDYNSNSKNKLQYIDVIDYMLNRKIPQFKEIPIETYFENVDIIDLMYVQIILESDLISINNTNESEENVSFNYLDLFNKDENKYFINILYDYLKNKENKKTLSININNFDEILNEKNKNIRVYKIAAFYKWYIENQKLDIIKSLRELLSSNKIKNKVPIRAHYYIYTYFQKVNELPYSQNTKDKIFNILNYILNYRFTNNTNFIPINILIYSDDKESVEMICDIIGNFMWFFGYIKAENLHIYDEYMNNIILDKFQTSKMFYKESKKKEGLMIIHNFENLLYTELKNQTLILNVLTDEIEKNNKQLCTVIYGNRYALKQILSNHKKLSKHLINFELEIDNLEINKIYELLITKLESSINITNEVKEKIYNYIKATYIQSDIKNMEYIHVLYNLIIFNMNNRFLYDKSNLLKLDDIPEAYNTRNLPDIMKDINELIGLTEIKEQINDLVYLLKFNKKANININDFNLHMIFSGNPGTGKTTVARLVKDIFYQLGYIKQDKLVEVSAKDLIAEYIGQTSIKTYDILKSAIGGVLFVDEAYSITEATNYGNECIATIIKFMEDFKDNLIIIFAGYEEEMDNFQEANPGLKSRIGYKIKFPDYTVDELIQIYLNLLQDNNLEITNEALNKLKEVIEYSVNCKDFGNARYIHHIFQRILIEHSKNIEINEIQDSLYKIIETDINYEKLIAQDSENKIGF